MPAIAIAIFVMLALSQGHIAPFDRALGPGYALVAIGGVYGIVIDARFVPRFLPPQDGEREPWTPDRDDIARAETLLAPLRPDDRRDVQPRAAGMTPEDMVSRTWYAATIDGRRLLFVDGYCSGGIPGHPLEPVLIADGGSCYWRATIDADSWELISYAENGEA